MGNESECAESVPVPLLRFSLVFCAGTPIALAGIIQNSLLLRFFFQAASRIPSVLYLATLAFLDISICACYIVIMGLDALAFFAEQGWLHVAWNYYCIPLFAYSRIVQLCSIYVIIAASMERWILTTGHSERSCIRAMTTNRARVSIIVFILFCAAAFQVPTVREFVIVSFPNCSGPMGTVTLEYSTFARTSSFKVYTSYLRPIVQIFVPFPLLLFLNLAIVRALQQQFLQSEEQRISMKGKFLKRGSRGGEALVVEQEAAPMAATLLAANVYRRRIRQQRDRETEQSRVRRATFSLAAIVASYLLCSSLDLLVKILEQLPGMPLLLEQKDGYQVETHFYSAATDVLSFLFMFNSFIRSFIYLAIDSDLRLQFIKYYYTRQ